MFSSALVGFLAAVSAAAWVYSKTMRRTGNNTKNALVVSGVTSVIVFILVVSVMSLVNSTL